MGLNLHSSFLDGAFKHISSNTGKRVSGGYLLRGSRTIHIVILTAIADFNSSEYTSSCEHQPFRSILTSSIPIPV